MTIESSPRHLQLRDTLFRRWKTLGLGAGDRIESQNEIVRFCDFSLITVVKTLKDLESEGIIRRQVGKGSFLVQTPWAEAHWRIGFFYNRDTVGGGIFDNEFYTRLVMAFEKGVVSDGHEFIMGSFTHQRMPVGMWDALDAVVLTGFTGETRLEALGETSSQVSLIDASLDGDRFHSYRLDYGPAFAEMFRESGARRRTYLYLDSKFSSNEQAARLDAFRHAGAGTKVDQRLEIIAVNQETDVGNTDALKAAIEQVRPDVVCGHIHQAWRPLIRSIVPDAAIYPFLLDSAAPGFVVDTAGWMRTILPMIYAHLGDRQRPPAIHTYPARFRP
ncbi:hypothetical protein OSH11_08520 [Kaistia dalseonensis]|uniref:HTH gntR-type domain-containing protein n=1 Tax=Kaistia dalseonensis TaxID=410840 RepID=A0ABU0H740_9HYPH|nr:hypothetical protein [Kaistia dalseonensis]MCX5494743.1 hypothetical protein [Kaistia dalseonensis]MDQ0437324.1 hypothetical protein [Kaistia dalseonensis]